MNLSTSHLIDSSNEELGNLYTIPAQINGEVVILSSTFDVHSPISGSLIHHCSSASVADGLSAVAAAQSVFSAWRDLPPAAKREIFLKTAEIFKSRKEELLRYMIHETGASEFWSNFNISPAADISTDIAGRISNLKGDGPVTGHLETSAIGIAPWNAPYILGVRSIAYALATGNIAIIKASELSPRCAWAIADCFYLGGLPVGVLNTIAHSTSSATSVTQALITDPRVQKINFTGSMVIGRIIAETSGRYLKPVLLELGGKALVIVCGDANLEIAATEGARGAFVHSGQVCMSTEKILVHKNVAAAFEERYREKVAKMFGEQGVLVNKAAVDRIMRLVREAVAKGEEVLTVSVEQDHQLSGSHMSPIVVKVVTEAMELYNTESFGSMVSIIEVETEEEAVRIANDTVYGLKSAVFTEDLKRGLRFAKRIDGGEVHINEMTVHDETMLPHGGAKCSGYGRLRSGGLEEWARSKTVTFRN